MKPECVYTFEDCPELEYSCVVHGPQHAMLKHEECEELKGRIAELAAENERLRPALEEIRAEASSDPEGFWEFENLARTALEGK